MNGLKIYDVNFFVTTLTTLTVRKRNICINIIRIFNPKKGYGTVCQEITSEAI